MSSLYFLHSAEQRGPNPQLLQMGMASLKSVDLMLICVSCLSNQCFPSNKQKI